VPRSSEEERRMSGSECPGSEAEGGEGEAEDRVRP